jgi:hypothetical protein
MGEPQSNTWEYNVVKSSSTSFHRPSFLGKPQSAFSLEGNKESVTSVEQPNFEVVDPNIL